jgi:hypothetical protein
MSEKTNRTGMGYSFLSRNADLATVTKGEMPGETLVARGERPWWKVEFWSTFWRGGRGRPGLE